MSGRLILNKNSLHRIRRGISLGVVALLAAGLIACQAIPGSGPVSEGLASLDQADQPVQFDPGGPAEGADQEEIVRGFVRAAASSIDDYAIAREFLSPNYADQWEPTAGVFVDEGAQPYSEVDENVGELSLSGIATVDEHGTLTPLEEGPDTTMRFEFERVGGEWRISSAPNGIILDQNRFVAVWTSRQLYFLSADERLVPETRWFRNGPTIATQIVGGLLHGPNEADIDALHTAFPNGSTLTSRAVPINGGEATIELSPELLGVDERTMEQAKRQLATSLQSVPGITSFELQINGAPIENAPVEAPEGDVRSVEYLQPVVLRDDVLGTVSNDGLEPIQGIGARVADLHPSAVSLNSDRTAAAVKHTKSGEQAISWVSADEFVTLDVRSGLLAPNLDKFGYVWSYATSEPGNIFVERPGQSAEMLKLPGVEGQNPVAVRLSPGGNRIAMLVGDAGGQTSSVIVVSIVRDKGSAPVALAAKAVRTMGAEGTPIDLDWVDELRVATLTEVGGGAKVTIGGLGQLPIDIGVVPGAVTVSGGGSRALMRLLDDEGRLYAPQGSGWQRQFEGIDLLARTG